MTASVSCIMTAFSLSQLLKYSELSATSSYPLSLEFPQVEQQKMHVDLPPNPVLKSADCSSLNQLENAFRDAVSVSSSAAPNHHLLPAFPFLIAASTQFWIVDGLLYPSHPAKWPPSLNFSPSQREKMSNCCEPKFSFREPEATSFKRLTKRERERESSSIIGMS